MKLFVWIATAISILTAIPLPATAQAREPLKIEDLLDSQEFGQITVPALSPDQQLLVYSVRRKPTADPRKSNAPATYWRDVDLYAINTQTLETNCITAGLADNAAPAWSPDGRYLAFLSDRGGSGVPNLWIWERSTNLLRKVSNVQVRSFDLQWRNTGEIVATISVGDSTQLERPHPSTQIHPDEVSNSQKASVTVFNSGGLTGSESPQVAPPWSLDLYRRDLGVIDIRSGEIRRLTRNARVGKFLVSPNGGNIAFSSPLRFENAGSQQIRWDLILLSLATNEQRILANDIRLEYDGSPFSWSPDSSKLAYLAGGPLERQDPKGTGDCFIIEAKSGRITNATNFLSRPAPRKQRSPLWSARGDTLYFIRDEALWKLELGHAPRELSRIAQHRVLELAGDGQGHIWSANPSSLVALTYNLSAKQSGFYRIDLQTGGETKLREEGCYDCANADDHMYVAPHGDRIVYFMEDATHEPNLWLADVGFKTVRQLTHLNPQLDKYQMGRSQLIEWRSLDGRQLQGSLLLPPDYRKDRRYPLIVWNYPGNKGSDNLNHFGLATGGPFNMQVFATRGYAVLYPDIPDIGASMPDIAQSVLPGINQLIALGIADPDRLGVMGQSFGGYSTVALIVESQRFKAAVEVDGLSNLITSYGQLGRDGSSFGISTSESGQKNLGGTPWQIRDKYVENSPYFYLDRVESPLLIIHGSDDSTVDPYLANELFVALRRLGKEVQYAKYDGEGHSPVYWNFPNQIDFCRRAVVWFDQHLAIKSH